MELLVNDLSLHGQFPDVAAFQDALSRVMTMRSMARQFGRNLYCHRNVAHTQVTPHLHFQQAIQNFDVNERRAVMQWLTQQGPFWEDVRLHSADDYLECNGRVVTDTAIGEAGYCCCNGIQRHLVSLFPSSWMFSPIPITWTLAVGSEQSVEVLNYWDPQVFVTALQALPAPIASWAQLAQVAMARCPNLSFSEDSFELLRGCPFVEGAAQRVLVLLDTLDLFKRCFDREGKRTQQGQNIIQNHFSGDKSWFSDSSDTEKNEFRQELTFRHPAANGETLFCTWHGKVKTPQLRIHFSWPVRADTPLYVVYVGPKITKR